MWQFPHQSLERDCVRSSSMRFEQLLRSRGFVHFSVSTLTPKYSAVRNYNQQQLDDLVFMLDQNSTVLSLPCELRLPFARYVAHNNLLHFNRFVIEKVYRRHKILGYHPHQFWECSVDIVSPSSTFSAQLADAEMLALICSTITQFPNLESSSPLIKVNHMQLLHVVLKLSGVPEAQLQSCVECIFDSVCAASKRNISATTSGVNTPPTVSPSSDKYQQQQTRDSGSLSPNVKLALRRDLQSRHQATPGGKTQGDQLDNSVISNIIRLLEVEADTPANIFTTISQICRKSTYRSEALNELETILNELDHTLTCAQHLGATNVPIKLSPSYILYAVRPIKFYSGLIVQLECKRRRRNPKQHATTNVILAVGGRYDRLIDNFSHHSVNEHHHTNDESISMSSSSTMFSHVTNLVGDNRKSAIGISFEIEKFARALAEDLERQSQHSLYAPTFNHVLKIGHAQSTLNATQGGGTSGIAANIAPWLKPWSHDLIVCSFTGYRSSHVSTSVCQIVRQLRHAGIRCQEVLLPDYPSHTLISLTNWCKEHHVQHCLLIRESYQDSPTSTHAQHAAISLAPISPNKTSNISMVPVTVLSATLVQIDRSDRPRELKRLDIPAMIEYLTKKSS
ncbi:eIF-2-alpha kinase GCN2 [Fragariocoptes setiger]|uniref:EIF-2-alpha kinase GCN2 n=1 Tax=Fragariocoptes setiger TaxID=1670756 RepID=A0ABQ7SB72_9ACAR|nr:eIF-2-alpha kinase GCN2 [Fragariocoptes setiger]